MRMTRDATILAAAMAMTAAGIAPASALGGGGTAPGGPLSGSVRPACNGYDMDGTLAHRACDGRSSDEQTAGARRPHLSR